MGGRCFDLVVFDLGGVLVRAARTWQEAFILAGFPIPEPDPELEARLAAIPPRDTGAITSEERYELLAKASGGRYSVDDYRRVDAVSLVGEYPGVRRVFDVIELAGLDTAILSNTHDAHWVRYFGSSLRPEFPALLRVRHRIASHLIGVLKPDPRAYRYVEMSTGYPSGRILFFDDRSENIEAARRLGWDAELIDYKGDTARQMLAYLRLRGVTALERSNEQSGG